MENCKYCFGSTNEILDLGFLPPVNVMAKTSENIQVNISYPLRLTFCPNCLLTQISDEIDENLIFPKAYPYLSGTTKILRENFAEQFTELIDFKPAKPNQLVIDIGSNDGTLLSNYQKNFTVLGIEPTDVAKVAIDSGVRTVQKFFNMQTAKEIENVFGKAQVVTACNVFAHIPNLSELMKGIDLILDKDGIFISESHYLTQLLETLQFDTIYHEHLRYYTGNFLSRLFNDFGFEIIKIKRIPTHGGSIRVWAARSGQYDVDEDVDKFLVSEKNSQFFGLSGHEKFAIEVLEWRQQFRKLIADLRISNKSIFGIGAPSRASTLVAYSGLEESDLSAVGEIRGSHKIGRYMPGTRIPIISEEEVLDQKPDYLLMLSWHISDELIPKIKKSGYSGKFIIPLPKIRII
jgi:hypothetical protein